ncbi:MAG: zinc ribbon domain-containing protein [Nitrospirae bacterium]|uniref:zinc ribbon domain-containing protein n=1 Tax=Candidatus Magnetobacterium casense TaxID=1455061 RepID=UPI00058E788C|nr:zinc ribbon domain-containing protein [Candidatus Magnetobacterium casensis]MBF0336318.1 zinc ribbon domain-containing protein [Nitrospirota bacterium]
MGATGTEHYRCPNCGRDIITDDRNCPDCKTTLAPVNVREAQRTTEQDALQRRYDEALQTAKNNDTYDNAMIFEGHLKKSFAVINMELEGLHSFITTKDDKYLPYARRVNAGEMRPLEAEQDMLRRKVDKMLFGVDGSDICYAAISIDGTGVKKYGNYTICLSDKEISTRTTLLEEDSFKFTERHNLAEHTEIPPGYRALWADRHKLAVAKLAHKLQNSFTDLEYANILVVNRERRNKYDFIEVHIYDGFRNEAVDKVYGPPPADPDEDILWSAVKDKLEIKGKQWSER